MTRSISKVFTSSDFRRCGYCVWPNSSLVIFEFFINMSTNKDCCKHCLELVRPRQEGIQCEVCDYWQHRTCQTGISREEYRDAVRSGNGLDWRCEDCLNMSAGFLLPNAESTRLSRMNENTLCKYFSFNYVIFS